MRQVNKGQYTQYAEACSSYSLHSLSRHLHPSSRQACANVRVDLDSRPQALDQCERKILQLEVEEAALAKEEDAASAARLGAVRAELEVLKEQRTALEGEYTRAQKLLEDLARLKREIEDTEWAIAENERKFRVEKAAELKYTELPRLKAQYADLLEEVKKGNSMLTDSVGPDHVAAVVSRWTGIPVAKLSQGEKDRVLGLAERLKGRVVGQDTAVTAVSDAIIRSRAGLSAAQRPIGTFLFLGPTGVGKTELSRALARELFDDDRNMIRVDCSEYMEQHSVARLIGAPPGYIGHDEGGQLTEPVRRRPYSVVLFDEVEKAHKAVLNVLLQVMDDGRLTDGKGRTVDFRNTVIILTSNVGADLLLKEMEQHGKITRKGHKQVMERLRSYFLPEFLNRLDDIVVFSPLSQTSLVNILEHQLEVATSKLRSPEYNITVTLAQSASQYLLQRGFDPRNGARPLRRLIERVLITELSRLIVGGDLPSNSEVAVEYGDEDGVAQLKYKVTQWGRGKKKKPVEVVFYQPLGDVLPQDDVEEEVLTSRNSRAPDDEL